MIDIGLPNRTLVNFTALINLSINAKYVYRCLILIDVGSFSLHYYFLLLCNAQKGDEYDNDVYKREATGGIFSRKYLIIIIIMNSNITK